MADDTITMDGRTYLSSARAAQLVGYTKDYVGQLARAGKIDAKLVGRSWYVEEGSVRKHKLGVHYTLTKTKKKTKKSQKDVSRESEKVNVHIDNSPSSYDVREGRSDTTVDRKTEAAQNASGDEAAKVAVADATLKLRKHHRSVDPLVHSDISYEAGEPVFYNDERPVFPKLTRVARFEGVPVGVPTQPVRVLKAQSVPVRTNSKRRFVARERPVIAEVRPTEAVRRRKARSARMIPGSGEHLEQQRHEGLLVDSSSKLLPVLGALVVFLLFVAWYYFIHGATL